MAAAPGAADAPYTGPGHPPPPARPRAPPPLPLLPLRRPLFACSRAGSPRGGATEWSGFGTGVVRARGTPRMSAAAPVYCGAEGVMDAVEEFLRLLTLLPAPSGSQADAGAE